MCGREDDRLQLMRKSLDAKTTMEDWVSIIISQAGRNAQRVERTVIQEESYLQQYIYDHPDTLPLQGIKDDLKLLILAREFPTASGPIDALGVDGDGDIYLIETKLYKNPDKRLVLAQILDYGAALWRAYEDPEALLERIDEILTARSQATLSSRVSDFYSLEGPALTEFTDNVKRSVSDGRFHFVVLMDSLDDRLKDLISFINANSNFDILGVGLEFYQHEGLDILIPTLFGAEAKKRAANSSGGPRRKWDGPSFFIDAHERLDDQAVAALRQLFDWTTEHADVVSWGNGTRSGSFSAKFAKVEPRSLFSAYSNGNLCLNFPLLNSTSESQQWARRFGEELNRAEILPSPANLEKYVYLPSDQWKYKVSAFTDVLGRLLP